MTPVHTLTRTPHGTSAVPNSVCRTLHFHLSADC